MINNTGDINNKTEKLIIIAVIKNVKLNVYVKGF